MLFSAAKKSKVLKLKANELGSRGEELVAGVYKKNGYKILGRNIRLAGYKQLGELDIVAIKKHELVFIEVKTRTSGVFMDAVHSLDKRKQKKLLLSVKAYLADHDHYQNRNCRIDVAIVDPTIDKPKDAVYIIEDAIQDE